MAKGLTKETAEALTKGISAFSAAVDKMAENTHPLKTFQTSVASLEKTLGNLKPLDEFNTNLKTNIENLSKIKLKVDTEGLLKGLLNGNQQKEGSTDAAIPKELEDAANSQQSTATPVNNDLITRITDNLKKVHIEIYRSIKAFKDLALSINPLKDSLNKIKEPIAPTNQPPVVPPRDATPEQTGGDGGGERGRGRGSAARSFVLNIAGFNVFSQLISSITALFSEAENLRKSLLGFGTDTEKFTRYLGSQVEGLRGSSLENLKNAASLYSDGFRGNNKGLLQVANRLELTNQSNEFLLKEFPNLAMSLRMSSDEMNNFAKKVDDAAFSYGVSTEKVVAGLSKIKILEDAVNLGQYGKQFAENISMMNAKFAGSAPMIEKFINSLFQNEKEVIAMGGGALLKQLEKAATPEEFEITIKKLSSLLGSYGEQFATQAIAAGDGGRSMFTVIKEMRGIFGEVAFDGLKLRDALKGQVNPAESAAAANKQFYDSLNTAMKELVTAFVPAMTFATRVVTVLIKAFGGIINFFGGPFVITMAAVTVGITKLTAVLLKGIAALPGLFTRLTTALTTTIAQIRGAGAAAAGGAAAGGAAATLGRLGAFLGGPWGMAISIGLSLVTGLLSNLSSSSAKTSEHTEKIREEARQQRKLQQEMAEAQKLEEQKKRDPKNAYQDVFRMINADLAFAVTNMRLDSVIALENSNRQVNLLETIAKNSRKDELPVRGKDSRR